MELYFLRHAIAEERGDPRYKDDGLRPLTAQGKRKMHRAALGIQALGLTFDAVISSPYLRAKQTAEIVAKVYKLKNKSIHLTNNLLPPASIEELLSEVSIHFPKSQKILLVGHEPQLSEMVSRLLKSGRPLDIDFKKGGLCCLSVPDFPDHSNAILHWLLTPAQLGMMFKEKQ
ncbi:MAG: phosphohistidine phosphatase SixA [Candidatus Omnitrophica bacterium]|nr:phosphohistidine phosphatase SixA [Candidatus Omnitrophota bacterium]